MKNEVVNLNLGLDAIDFIIHALDVTAKVEGLKACQGCFAIANGLTEAVKAAAEAAELPEVPEKEEDVIPANVIPINEG